MGRKEGFKGIQRVGVLSCLLYKPHKIIRFYRVSWSSGDFSSLSGKTQFVAAKPYVDIDPIKLECVGHVQKRMGTRLRNKVKEHKGRGYPISGKGKLTEKVINSMQTSYGKAIRDNINNVYAMKKAIAAIYYHCCEGDEKPNEEYRHRYCPMDSWYKFKKDLKTGENTYKKTIDLPRNIFAIISQIFELLSQDELLLKRVHGETQNPNEAFNGIVWKKCPKVIFVHRHAFEMRINSAILHFNDGAYGVTKILQEFSIKNGIFTDIGSTHKDEKSVQWSTVKNSDTRKKRRKKLRMIKSGIIDNEKVREGKESYIAGGF